MRSISSFVEVRVLMLVVSALVLMANTTHAQQDARAEAPPRPGADSARSEGSPRSNPSGVRPSYTGAEPPVVPAGQEPCGDALSNALHADPESMPCWANIRTVERWNTADIPDGRGLRGSTSFHLPAERHARASVVLGSVGGTLLSENPAPHGYGGLAAFSALVGSRRWQLEAEDGGSMGDLIYKGTNSAVGLNRGALRFAGETTPRLLWQASAANTYGTDAYRLLAPLDYRQVGFAEAPVPETVAFGLHAGRVTDEQEDAKLRYEFSRRTNLDLVAGHTLEKYSDDGVKVQTVQGRVELLHAITPSMAMGLFGTAGHQGAVLRPNGFGECLLSGGGLRALANWDNRAKLNVSGGASKASAGCGRAIQVTGDLAFSIRVRERSAVFLTLDRGFSGGVYETAPFLSSATTGVHHSFTSGLTLGLSGVGALGDNPTTRHQYVATFGELAATYHFGPHLTQETTVRRYEADTPAALGRTALTFTLWVNPRSAHAETNR